MTQGRTTTFEAGSAFEAERERAVLVGIDRGNPEWPVEESLAELERLADTAGAETVATTYQRLASPNPKTFIGSGKAEEVAQLVKANDAQVVIFDDELSPSQQANLERAIPGAKIIDRTALVLDIFSLHAVTREGRLQVRLAKNQYLYPRLRGMWAHLASNRMGGGVGSRFGEGESQLEVDRRMVRKRIDRIKKELAKLESDRDNQRKARLRQGMSRVSLVGYTNAGKSTLINRLTGADVLATDRLFATLDSTTRKLVLPEGRTVTITDTVGFIQKLPTTLVEAFKSTLDEISDSDLMLIVLDASSTKMESQYQAVLDILEQIGAQSIPSITVLNKMDLLDSDEREVMTARYPMACAISAELGQGIDELVERISQVCSDSDATLNLVIPFERGDLISLAHSKCTIVAQRYEEDGLHLSLKCPKHLQASFADFAELG
ncbi:MAG: GTPase HflX [Coriobacteriales bacterium]|nr:GTPase HflX [Coriobacteriales bacterium]